MFAELHEDGFMEAKTCTETDLTAGEIKWSTQMCHGLQVGRLKKATIT